MTESAFGWLDHSEQQRRQMLEFVDAFRDKGTMDELGAGVIRDALAEHFFPGTSTLQSRARYFLFVPWIYQRLEYERVPSAKLDRRARHEQARLVKALVAGGEREGVIGIDAGAQVVNPPSTLYWVGLRTLGILRYSGSYQAYASALDANYRLDRSLLRSDEGELVEEAPRAWHGGLPLPPADFLDRTTFSLSRDEAEYLRERIVTARRESLLAAFVSRSTDASRVDYPWNHPDLPSLPRQLRDDLADAECFSLVAHGAYVLYNLMLAELAVAAGMTARQRNLEQYTTGLADWVQAMASHEEALRGWRTDRLWQLIARIGQRIPLRTRDFFDRWADVALHQPDGIASNARARELIRERERSLKRGLARLHNPMALIHWGGASSTGRLSFRWGNAKRLISDVQAGLRRRPQRADA